MVSELSDVIRAVNEHFFVPEPQPEAGDVLLALLKQIADTSEDDMARVEALGTLGTLLGMFNQEAAPVVMH